MNTRYVAMTVVLVVAAFCTTVKGASAHKSIQDTIRVYSVEEKGYVLTERVVKSDAEWINLLTSEQFRVTRKKGTETAFSNQYWNNYEKGT